MRLSVCLLTRNEEDNLPRVLRSVPGVADEIVVADTDSTDRTRQVAEQHGAQVIPVEWADDFSAGRNAALERARGDWILWLNPDEELLPTDPVLLQRYLDRSDVLAYVLKVQELVNADAPDYFSETVQPRLFRRRDDIRYAGRLHPSFRIPLLDLAKQSSMQVLPAIVTIRHHAYLSILNKGKLRWALRLVELELKDRPGQLHFMIDQGRTLLLLDDPKGHEILAQAIDEMLKHKDEPLAPANNAGQLIEYLLTVAPQQAERQVPRAVIYELVLKWFAQSPPVLWRLAEVCFQGGEFRQAAFLLEQLVHYGRTGTYDRSAAFDPAVLGDGALLNLGVCYGRLGQFERAESCLTQLVHSSTHGEQAGKFLAEITRLKSRPPP